MKAAKIIFRIIKWGVCLCVVVAIFISILVNLVEKPRKSIQEAIELSQRQCPMILPANMGSIEKIVFEQKDDHWILPTANVVYYVKYTDILTTNIMQLMNKEGIEEIAYLINSIFNRHPSDYFARQKVNLLQELGNAGVGIVYDFSNVNGNHSRIELPATDITRISMKERMYPAQAIEKLLIYTNTSFPFLKENGVLFKSITSDSNYLVYHIELSVGELTRSEINTIMSEMDERSIETFCLDAFIGDFERNIVNSSTMGICIKLEDRYSSKVRNIYLPYTTICYTRPLTISSIVNN